MSSIGEARELIAAASTSADEAQQSVASASTAIEEATEAVNQAAGDSGHAKIDEALAAFREAGDKLAEIAALITQGQEATDEYAQNLG
jgi:ABC-type transporter Mla subunit MlaD